MTRHARLHPRRSVEMFILLIDLFRKLVVGGVTHLSCTVSGPGPRPGSDAVATGDCLKIRDTTVYFDKRHTDTRARRATVAAI